MLHALTNTKLLGFGEEKPLALSLLILKSYSKNLTSESQEISFPVKGKWRWTQSIQNSAQASSSPGSLLEPIDLPSLFFHTELSFLFSQELLYIL